MQSYQKEFIDLALDVGALRFGEFKLKSGRVSPYFFNAGHFSTGRAAAQLGRFYAATIAAAALPFDMIFGPAYKGIPLAALTAAALAEYHDLDVAFAYNRKEAKNHGEGGNIVGAALAGRVLIIDDVITAGTAVREACELISGAGAEIGGLVISLDRQERGTGQLSAVQELENALGIAVTSIVRFEDLVESIEESGKYDEYHEALLRYRRQYGASPRGD